MIFYSSNLLKFAQLFIPAFHNSQTIVSNSNISTYGLSTLIKFSYSLQTLKQSAFSWELRMCSLLKRKYGFREQEGDIYLTYQTYFQHLFLFFIRYIFKHLLAQIGLLTRKGVSSISQIFYQRHFCARKQWIMKICFVGIETNFLKFLLVLSIVFQAPFSNFGYSS